MSGSKESAFTFKNDSNKLIDSALVNINGLRILFPEIKPNQQITRLIKKGAIPDNHDIVVIANIYSKDTSKPTEGFYYNDLTSFIDDHYIVTLTGKNHIDIRSK